MVLQHSEPSRNGTLQFHRNETYFKDQVPRRSFGVPGECARPQHRGRNLRHRSVEERSHQLPPDPTLYVNVSCAHEDSPST